MQVVKNEQVFRIGWRYENPNLKRVLDAFDITEEQMHEITERKIPDEARPGKERRAGIPSLIATFEAIADSEVDNERKRLLKKVLDKLRMKGIPRPTITKCLMYANKAIVNYAIVRKFPGDPHDREKARKESLGKLLRDEFPGIENKITRRKFWNEYLNEQNTPATKPTNGVAKHPEEFIDRIPVDDEHLEKA